MQTHDIFLIQTKGWSETEYYSHVTTLLLHEDLSSEQRCSNSWNKHISPNIFQKSGDIDVKQIWLCDKLDIPEDCS